jgi:hypothetical protein
VHMQYTRKINSFSLHLHAIAYVQTHFVVCGW